jgi:hypothetical protein
MARIGLYSSLMIVVFGVVVPFFIFKLGRLIGLAPLLVLGFFDWSRLRRARAFCF